MHDEHEEAQEAALSPSGLTGRAKVIVLAIVILVFGVVLASRGLDTTPQGAVPIEDQGGQLTVGEDPVAAYESALQAGRPIYVLFHSQGCAPCQEIEQVVARVLPDYAAELTYVDVITNDSRARPLFQQFPFQYIPTSFFLDENGEIIDSYTGVLSDEDMRARFDSLLETTASEAAEW